MSGSTDRERVPARIAKGELDGKMKARVWKKLHREEAERFHQAYELMGKNPGLGLQEAFGVLQSGLSVDEFLKRRARTKKKEEVKVAKIATVGLGVAAILGVPLSAAERIATPPRRNLRNRAACHPLLPHECCRRSASPRSGKSDRAKDPA